MSKEYRILKINLPVCCSLSKNIIDPTSLTYRYIIFGNTPLSVDDNVYTFDTDFNIKEFCLDRVAALEASLLSDEKSYIQFLWYDTGRSIGLLQLEDSTVELIIQSTSDLFYKSYSELPTEIFNIQGTSFYHTPIYPAPVPEPIQEYAPDPLISADTSIVTTPEITTTDTPAPETYFVLDPSQNLEI